jgi:hypothetical protein
VIIEVGDVDPEKYYVHRALLVHHSEYFRKALQGPWREAEEGVVRLKDVDYKACKYAKIMGMTLDTDVSNSQCLCALALHANCS